MVKTYCPSQSTCWGRSNTRLRLLCCCGYRTSSRPAWAAQWGPLKLYPCLIRMCMNLPAACRFINMWVYESSRVRARLWQQAWLHSRNVTVHAPLTQCQFSQKLTHSMFLLCIWGREGGGETCDLFIPYRKHTWTYSLMNGFWVSVYETTNQVAKQTRASV